MKSSAKDVVFFDLSRTLGRTVLSADRSKLVRFEVYASTRNLLAHLQNRVRLGLVAFGDTPSSSMLQPLLGAEGLASFFEPQLVLALPVMATTHFAALANRAEAAPEQCLFVSRDANRRNVALDAQFRVAPAAKYVMPVLAGEKLTYVRLRSHGSRDASLAPLLAIPGLEVFELGGLGTTYYGFATESAKQKIQQAEFSVEDFMSPETAAVTRLFVIRDGLDAEFIGGVRKKLRIVEETPAGLLVGLPPDHSIDDYHPKRAAHGHTTLAQFAVSPPAEAKGETTVEAPPAGRATAALLAAGPDTPCNPEHLPVGALSVEDAATLSELDAALVQQYLDPLIGSSPLYTGETINSRATLNTSNGLAVQHVANELQAILGNAITIPFTCDLGELHNVQAEIRGSACPRSVIILGAHLDSTAISDAGWIKATGAAPGADDDASGVAGVLAAAKVLAKLGQPKRTIRFVLFNAEEEGLLGSLAYVEELVDLSVETVIAMIQLDMIGHLNAAVPERRIEIHPPGSTDFKSVQAEVIARSGTLATTIGTMAGLVSPSLNVQTYPLAPCTTDPVAGRSDHKAFVISQMPACDLSEEMFGDSCATSGLSHTHPGYHLPQDTIAIIDESYVADIARAAAAAAWVIANG